LLRRVRPGPDLVEVTRTALTLCTMLAYLVQRPNPARWLARLRRLPPAPADTLVRAAGPVLRAAAADSPAALHALCDSDEPLVAGVANAIATYLWENQGDPDGARKAADRMLWGRGTRNPRR